MKIFKKLAILVCLFATIRLGYSATQTINTLPSANATFIATLQTFLGNEIAEYVHLRLPDEVYTGGLGTTDADLTNTISAVTAFPNGFYTYQAATSHTYIASKRTFVFVRDSDSRTVTISAATITYDGYLVFAEMAAASAVPARPEGTLALFYVDTDGTSITAVTNQRFENSEISLVERFSCDLADAVTEIGSAVTTLVIDCTADIPDGETVTTHANTSVYALNGGVIDTNATGAVVFGGPFDGGLTQHFDTSGGGTVTGLKTANPIWFGAVGDGATDDTEAIQRANDSGAGAIMFGPGAYIISGDITLDVDGLEIIGVGNPVIQFDNSTDPYATYGTRVGMFNVRADNIHIHGITLDQNFRNSGRVDGDSARIGGIIIGGQYDGDSSDVNGTNIHDCQIYDYYGDAISAFTISANNTQIKDNLLTSTYIVQSWATAGAGGEQGISLSSGSHQQITGNTILGALDDAIAIHGWSEDVTILDNVITTTGGRILINGGLDVVVSDNNITYIQDGSSAIYISFETAGATLKENDNVLVSGNVINIPTGVVCSNAIYAFGAGDNITIRGNLIKTVDAQSNGIWVNDKQWTGGDSNYYNVNKCLIENNTIIGYTTGIKESYGSTEPTAVVVKNNHIVGATTDINVSTYTEVQYHHDSVNGTYQNHGVILVDDRIYGPSVKIVESDSVTLSDNVTTDIFSVAIPDGNGVGIKFNYLIERANSTTTNFSAFGTIYYTSISDSSGNITVGTPASVGDVQALDGYSSLVITPTMSEDEAGDTVTVQIKQVNNLAHNGKLVYTAEIYKIGNSASKGFINLSAITFP